MMYELSYIAFDSFRDRIYINNKILYELGIRDTYTSGVIKYVRILRNNAQSILNSYDNREIDKKVIELFKDELYSLGKHKIIKIISEYDEEVRELRKKILSKKINYF